MVLGASCGDSTGTDQPNNRIPADVPPSQRDALADGEVTVAELESGFQLVVACMEDQGVTVTVSRVRMGRGDEVLTDLGYETRPGAEVVEDGCKRDHFNALYQVYASQHIQSEAERDDLVEHLASCASEQGLSVDSWPRDQLASILQREHPDVFGTCMSSRPG